MVKTNRARKQTKTPTPDDAEPAAKVAKLGANSGGGHVRKFSMPVPQRAVRIGQLLSCGQNEVGQLGLGEDVPEKTRPAAIPLCPNAVDIAAGGMHSLYLDAAGAVFSFGCNDEGALGRDTSAEGSEFEIVRVELPLPVVRLTAGDSHSACLLEDGRVLAWGSFRDSHGNMGLTLEGNKRFPVEVVPGTKFADIASGADHLVMLTTDGKVFTVGCAEQGQLGRVTMRSSGGESRRGKTDLLRPGQVRFKSSGAIDAIWATTYCTFTRVHGTNEIVAFGLNNYAQLAVHEQEQLFFNPKSTTIQNVKFISGGQHHTLLLTNDNRCQVIGRRDYGRLGIGQVADDLKTLTEVTALTDKHIVQVACGESCSFARTADGLVYAWGIGSNQQLGVGSDEDAYEPVLLTGVQVKGKVVLNVNGGGQHTLLLVASADSAMVATADEKKAVNGTAAAETSTKATKANGVLKSSKSTSADAAKVEASTSNASTEPAIENDVDDDANITAVDGNAATAIVTADAVQAADEVMPETMTAASKTEKKIAVAKKKVVTKAGFASKKEAAATEAPTVSNNENIDTGSTSTAADVADEDANESVKSSKSTKSTTSKASKASADTKKKPATAAASKAPAKKRKL